MEEQKTAGGNRLYGLKMVVIVWGVVFLAGLFRGIDWPLAGPNSTNLEMFSIAAKNYLKFGLIGTKGLQVVEEYTSLPERPRVYTHHPPLTPIVMAGWMRIWGESIPVIRWSQIFPLVVSVFLMYAIGKKLSGERAGWGAALAFMLIPATTVFGRNTGLESMNESTIGARF